MWRTVQERRRWRGATLTGGKTRLNLRLRDGKGTQALTWRQNKQQRASMAAGVARVAAVPRLAPRVTRRARRAPAPPRSHAPHGDAAAAALVAWLREDGAFVSPKLGVNAYAPGGLRGVVAAADIEAGDTLIDLPASCTCFSADAARDELPLGVGQALRAVEGEAACGDDAALALWLAAAACAPPGLSPLSPYAAALPEEAPDLPSRWPQAQAEALLPFYLDAALAEDAQAADEALSQAAAAAAHLPSPPPLERLEWAWAHVRARAIRFQARAARCVLLCCVSLC